MRLLTHLLLLAAGSSAAAAHVAPRQEATGPPETPTPTVSTCTNSSNATWEQVLDRFPPGSLSATTALPVPALTVDFRLQVDLNPKIALGKGVWGERNWISFKSGQWSATWGNGTVEVCCLFMFFVVSLIVPPVPTFFCFFFFIIAKPGLTAK